LALAWVALPLAEVVVPALQADRRSTPAADLKRDTNLKCSHQLTVLKVSAATTREAMLTVAIPALTQRYEEAISHVNRFLLC
jgi:hypothetical protein